MLNEAHQKIITEPEISTLLEQTLSLDRIRCENNPLANFLTCLLNITIRHQVENHGGDV